MPSVEVKKNLDWFRWKSFDFLEKYFLAKIYFVRVSPEKDAILWNKQFSNENKLNVREHSKYATISSFIHWFLLEETSEKEREKKRASCWLIDRVIPRF